MDKMITNIHQITNDMYRSLIEENYEEFEQLLHNRTTMMIKVDALTVEFPSSEHAPNVKQLLEDTRYLDERMKHYLKENITETQKSLNQMKQVKQVSKKFRPYIKQTNGVFLDSKK